MNLMFKTLLLFFVFSRAFTAELLYDVYGYYDFITFFKVSETRNYIVYDNKVITLTNIGVSGKSHCTGILEVENGETFASNIMCKFTESNGDTNFTQFKTDRGSFQEGAGVNSFIFVSGEGRWEELVGQKCIGAFADITGFEKDFKGATFEWKGKCQMADKTFERLKNYKKPE